MQEKPNQDSNTGRERERANNKLHSTNRTATSVTVLKGSNSQGQEYQKSRVKGGPEGAQREPGPILNHAFPIDLWADPSPPPPCVGYHPGASQLSLTFYRIFSAQVSGGRQVEAKKG